MYEGPHVPSLHVSWGRGEWESVGDDAEWGQDYGNAFINRNLPMYSCRRPFTLVFSPHRFVASPATQRMVLLEGSPGTPAVSDSIQLSDYTNNTVNEQFLGFLFASVGKFRNLEAKQT